MKFELFLATFKWIWTYKISLIANFQLILLSIQHRWEEIKQFAEITPNLILQTQRRFMLLPFIRVIYLLSFLIEFQSILFFTDFLSLSLLRRIIFLQTKNLITTWLFNLYFLRKLFIFVFFSFLLNIALFHYYFTTLFFT